MIQSIATVLPATYVSLTQTHSVSVRHNTLRLRRVALTFQGMYASITTIKLNKKS